MVKGMLKNVSRAFVNKFKEEILFEKG